MIVVLLSAIITALLWHPAAADPRLRDAPLAAGRVRLHFREHLGISPELRLTKTTDTRSVSFTLPARWKAVPGGSLHLFIQHSAELDGSRSFLSVSLNYGILRSFRLDPQNAAGTEVVVPIPPEMLKAQNVLAFSVEQSPAPSAKSGEIWSSIGARSFLDLRYEEAPPELNLGRLTASVLEPHGLGKNRLAVLLPKRYEPTTVEATVLLVAHLGKRSAPDRMVVDVVRSIRSTRDPLLVVGTPADQPELASLNWQAPLAFASVNRRLVLQAKNGGALGENDGVVGLATRTRADRNPVLLVTGNSPNAVLRAARAVIGPNWNGSGHFARVVTEARWSASRVREWPGFVPPQSSFTLADLDLEDPPITTERGSSLVVPLQGTPDAQFFDYGNRMELKFKLNSDVDISAARLLVQVNDVTLADRVVKEEFRGSVGSVLVTIPARVLKPRNVLTITWKGPSHGATQGALGWLLSSSEFYLPRYYATELPDLGLLRFHLYPFSLRADLSDVVVVPTGDLGPETFSALLELAGAFARLAPGRHLAFRVRRLGDLTAADRAQSHLVFLNLEDRRDPLSTLIPNWKPRPPKDALRGRPTIREMLSPWNSNRYLLIISAHSGRLLQRTVRDLFSEATLARLGGDVAYLVGGQPEIFVVGPRHRVREYSYLSLITAWLRTYWLVLPIILIAVSGLLFVGVRLALRHHGRSSSLTPPPPR